MADSTPPPPTSTTSTATTTDSKPTIIINPELLSPTPPAPILTHPRFYIRAYTLADAPKLCKAGNSPEIAHRMGDRFPAPYHLQDANDFITRMGRPDPKAGLLDRHFGIWAARSPSQQGEQDGGNEEETLMGGIGFMPQPHEARYTAEIGYWLSKPYWGKGLATAIAGEFVKWCFAEHPHILKLQAKHHGGNVPSGRVLEKNGFVREGILRKAWACRDNGIVKREETADVSGAGDLLATAAAGGESIDGISASVAAEGGKPKTFVLDLYMYGLLREDHEETLQKASD